MYKKEDILRAIEQTLTNEEKEIVFDRLGVNKPPLSLKELYKKYNLNIKTLNILEKKIVYYLKNNNTPK